MKKEVWSSYRKLMSNLVPMCFFVPVFAAGLFLYQHKYVGAALACIIAAPLIGIAAVNFFGLFQNSQMKREMLSQKPAADAVFVGFSPPGKVNMLDPHDDVGWFVLRDDGIEFVGEKSHYKLLRSEIMGVRFRPNLHTLLGLGRWLSIEGRRGDKPVRMLVEPREEKTLLRNKRAGSILKARVNSWLAGGPTPP